MAPLLLLLASLLMTTADETLLTVAERSDFRRTSRHADVVALVDALVASSPLATRGTLGTSFEGRELPLLILADPPVADRDAARAAVADGRVLAFVFANIHAGEVCGKEASLILARQILGAPEDPVHAALLRELVLVIAPIYNADGNERMAPGNRPGQIGPDEMGTRPNAQGQDLNRDAMKLSSPEARAMARFLVEWDPHLIMDLHTTNGSLHRYALTWAPPLNPAGPTAPLAIVRDRLLPQVTERIREATGLEMFAYGNFDAERTRWETYSSLPRFGAQYHGLRGHLSILSEAYSKIPFAERVEATRVFVRQCLLWAAEHADEVRAAFDAGRAETIARGAQRSARDRVGIRHELARGEAATTVLGWVEERDADGRWIRTGEPLDRSVEHWDHFEPVAFVERPLAYLVPPGHDTLLELLALHGVESFRWGEAVGFQTELATFSEDVAEWQAEVADDGGAGATGGDGDGETARGEVGRALARFDVAATLTALAAAGADDLAARWTARWQLTVERYRLDAVQAGQDSYLGHDTPDVAATPLREALLPDAAWTVVPLDQALGTLIVHLLEPEAEDSVAPQLLRDQLVPGGSYPLLRLVEAQGWSTQR